MGILDSLLDTAMSSLGGGDGQQNQAMKLVMHLVQQNGGNIGGLLSQLQQGGLGDVLQSWIGSNSNESVSAGAIENALGATSAKRHKQSASTRSRPAACWRNTCRKSSTP